jgi:hypothetical protein
MTLLRIIIGVVLLALGSFISVMNWGVVIQWLTTKRHSSWVPVVGGAIASGGMAILPYASVNKLWWIPLVADWGCIPGISFSGFAIAWRLLQRRT